MIQPVKLVVTTGYKRESTSTLSFDSGSVTERNWIRLFCSSDCQESHESTVKHAYKNLKSCLSLRHREAEVNKRQHSRFFYYLKPNKRQHCSRPKRAFLKTASSTPQKFTWVTSCRGRGGGFFPQWPLTHAFGISVEWPQTDNSTVVLLNRSPGFCSHPRRLQGWRRPGILREPSHNSVQVYNSRFL